MFPFKPSIMLLLGLYSASMTPAQEIRNNPATQRRPSQAPEVREREQPQPKDVIQIPDRERPRPPAPAAGPAVSQTQPGPESLGPPRVVVPPLTGMTEAKARSALDESGLVLGDVGGNNTEGSTVASQSLTAGVRVPRGTPVGLTMQPPPPAEPQPVVVPAPTPQPSIEQPPSVVPTGIHKKRPSPTPWWQTATGVLSLAGIALAGIVSLGLLFRTPPTPTGPPAGFSLKVNRGAARTRFREQDDPKIRFTVSLRDRMTALRYKMDKGPAVWRKG